MWQRYEGRTTFVRSISFVLACTQRETKSVVMIGVIGKATVRVVLEVPLRAAEQFRSAEIIGVMIARSVVGVLAIILVRTHAQRAACCSFVRRSIVMSGRAFEDLPVRVDERNDRTRKPELSTYTFRSSDTPNTCRHGIEWSASAAFASFCRRNCAEGPGLLVEGWTQSNCGLCFERFHLGTSHSPDSPRG